MMTNGQHRARVRAWQREQAIAPRYVGNELAGTRQAATHHHTATLRQAEAEADAEADAATDLADQARLRQEVADARALAATLDQHVTQLEELDRAYLRHRVHSAVTRVNGEVSARILAERDADNEPEQQVTAEEWLAAHRAALADDERDRPVGEDDLDDRGQPVHANPLGADSGRDFVGAQASRTVDDVVEPNLCEIAAAESRQTREDETRVPDAGEIATSVGRARRTIREITAREAYDQQHEQDERAALLRRWHDDDHDSELRDAVDGDHLDDTDDWADEDGPVLSRDQLPGQEPAW